MDKELELEVEKLYPVNHTGSMFMANREQINNFYKQKGFIAGATSKYVEKQKGLQRLPSNTKTYFITRRFDKDVQQ